MKFFGVFLSPFSAYLSDFLTFEQFEFHGFRCFFVGMYFYHFGKNICTDFAFPEIADDLCRNKGEPCVFLRDSFGSRVFVLRRRFYV